MQEFISNSESETRSLGVAIGESLEPGIVIGLNGTLGSGKTRLTQAIGIGLGIAEGEVVSPTFTICVPHEGRLPFLHLDAYRIKQLTEIDELGLDESVEDGIVLIVEWAIRIEKYLPPIDLNISIEPVGAEIRRFHFDPISEQGKQLVNRIFAKLEPKP